MIETYWGSFDLFDVLYALIVYAVIGILLAGVFVLERYRKRGEKDDWYRILSCHEYAFLLAAVLWPLFPLVLIGNRWIKRRKAQPSKSQPDSRS